MEPVGWIKRSGSTNTDGRNGGSAALDPPYRLRQITLSAWNIFFAAAGNSWTLAM